ncbi:FadR/GntR family transcriptional regulator [Mycobacterium sp. URHD0025]|uniref:FadR/GntR family transcriptional regulator n=1 Tax=Mycobacterium sp. URHD0025 TaxID=1298864 RepID=UPI0012DD2FE8|nr:FadR/GntR family transcriptional regulator [Mycobacterium sp. URHD0025]
MPSAAMTGDEFVSVKLGRMSRLVVEQFQEHMRMGKLTAGDKLPPERELSTMFGVGRNTMREALRELELLGMVTSRHGEGTFVAVPSPADVAAPFRAVIELSSAAEDSVMEFRHAFEPGVAALAAKVITDDARQTLLEALTRFESCVDAADAASAAILEAQAADAAFHRTIAHATANPTVIAVYDAVDSLLSGSRVQLDSRTYQPTSSQARGHRLIYEAITAGDPQRAALEMRQHLEDVSSCGC